MQNCTAVFWRKPFYHSSSDATRPQIYAGKWSQTYIKTSEGLLRGEWYKLVAHSPRESRFKSHRELMAQTEILLRIENEVAKQTRTGWRNKGILGWEGDGREMRYAKCDHVLKKVVPAVVEAKEQQRNFKDRSHNSKQNGSFRSRKFHKSHWPIKN